MKYQELGKSGIMVSKVSLGAWGLGGGSVWSDKTSTVEDTIALLDACQEHGINYIDTAPVYGMGYSEELLGQALKGRRDKFVVQTKCALNWRREGGDFHYSRDGYTVCKDTGGAAVRKDAEDSLRRLQIDCIDSLVVHYVCASYPVEETVQALEDLIREGKIRTYGLSNSQPSDLEEYAGFVPAGAAGVSLVQEFFSILSPFHGRDYFGACKKNRTTFQTYGVLEEGFLTSPAFLDRKFVPSDIRSRLPWVDPVYQEGIRRAFEAWAPLCQAHGCSFSNLMEAWALTQDEGMNLLIGMRRPENVADTAKAVDIALSPEEVLAMEEIVKSIQVEVLDK